MRASLALVGVAAVAFWVRLAPVLHGGGLRGLLGYDDGVYYSGAAALLAGRMPYRDFLLLHPPGVLVALAPFAEYGRLTHDSTGLATARVACMLIGALNAVLVMRATRSFGLVAATAGGLFYAVWAPAAFTETTTRLEPFVNLGLLACLALLARRNAPSSPVVQIAAGAAAGFACMVKIWALVPAMIIMLWYGVRLGPRAGARIAGGAVATSLVIGLPFLLAAPGTMFRMVVLDQIRRGHTSKTPAGRWAAILAIPDIINDATFVQKATSLLVATLLLACAAALALSLPGARLPVILLLAQSAVLLLAPSFFGFYAAFAAPALALTVAGAAGRITRWLAARSLAIRRNVTWTLVAAGVLAAVLLGRSVTATAFGRPFPALALAPATAASRCVTADSVEPLVLLDVLSRNLRRHCPVMIDVIGLAYDRDAQPLRADRHAIPRRHNKSWQHDLISYLEAGDTTMLVGRRADDLDAASARRIASMIVVAESGGFRVYRTGQAS